MSAPLARLMPLLLLLVPTAASAGALHVEGAQLRDGTGGAVILRGVNVAGNSKVPPFRAISDAAQLDLLPRLGMNVVRLLFTWEAYEPQPGTYDAAYLEYYVSTVKAAAARGLYVVVDFHQDGYSRFSIGGCGEGFPSWALPSTVTPANPDNGPTCTDWGLCILTDAVLQRTWDAFYADSEGVRTRYLAMIGRVVTALGGESMVIGYDVLNEPGGDELTQIGPLYEDAAKVIRALDPSAILFVSPGAVTSAGTATALPRPSFSNFVYAPHFYDVTLTLFHAWQGSDEQDPFDRMAGTASAWGVPLFVGEYGAPPTTGDVDGYLGALAMQLARTMASGAQWVYTPNWDAVTYDGWNREDFSIVDGSGGLRANFRPRPFARRVAGTPTSMALLDERDVGKRSFVLDWDHDPSAGETELYAPEEWFDGGAEVAATGGLVCTRASDLVRCGAGTAGAKRVTLTAATPRCGLTGGEALLLVAAARRIGRRRAR